MVRHLSDVQIAALLQDGDKVLKTVTQTNVDHFEVFSGWLVYLKWLSVPKDRRETHTKAFFWNAARCKSCQKSPISLSKKASSWCS
jgi:hypothetical protein